MCRICRICRTRKTSRICKPVKAVNNWVRSAFGHFEYCISWTIAIQFVCFWQVFTHHFFVNFIFDKGMLHYYYLICFTFEKYLQHHIYLNCFTSICHKYLAPLYTIFILFIFIFCSISVYLYTYFLVFPCFILI